MKANLTPADVLRTADKTAKELELTKKTAAEKLVSLMIEFPQLLQRPIVEIGDKAILARPFSKGIEFALEEG